MSFLPPIMCLELKRNCYRVSFKVFVLVSIVPSPYGWPILIFVSIYFLVLFNPWICFTYFFFIYKIIIGILFFFFNGNFIKYGRKIKSLIIYQCKAQNIYIKKDKIKELLRNTSFSWPFLKKEKRKEKKKETQVFSDLFSKKKKEKKRKKKHKF